MIKGSKSYYSIFKAGLFLAILLFFFISCKKTSNEMFHFRGETMGTYYSIKYLASERSIQQGDIDSLLKEVNNQVSTYIPNSVISQINRSERQRYSLDINDKTEIFIDNLKLSKDIYSSTKGYFDPTVMPLVNFWGFGYKKRALKDTAQLDSLKALVGFDKWSFEQSNEQLNIVKPEDASIDFSAVAKGLGIDEIAEFFEDRNIQNYFIDIGGETRAKGNKENNKDWIIGINTPKENADVQDVKVLLKLKNKSIATSGNYRNFYTEGGRKYVHTINPFKGNPEQSKLLSASIIASNCGLADGLATACMVMGLERSKEFVNRMENVEAILIFANDHDELETWYSPSVKSYIVSER